MMASQDYLNSNSLDPLKKQKKKFTVYEDALLIKYVSLFGENNWKLISKYFTNRNTRQLRERYTLYLKPGNLDTPWTHEEDILLYQKIKEIGKHWSLLAKYFKGRNQNNIKNRWNFHLKCGTNLHIEDEKSSKTQKTSVNSFNIDYDTNIINNNENDINNNSFNMNNRFNSRDQIPLPILSSNIKKQFYVLPMINKDKIINKDKVNEKSLVSSFNHGEKNTLLENEFQHFCNDTFSDLFDNLDDEDIM